MPIVAVLVVATVVAVTAAVLSADGKIRATSAVDPNASVIKAPSLSELAGSFAALANQAHTTVGVDTAAAEVEVIGRAIERADSVASAISVFSSANGEIRAASPVDPNAVSREAPGPPVNTRRLATLADEFDATGAVDRAEMSREIVRGAV
jgi:hypothetical protein